MPVVLILIFAVTGASHWIENGEMLLMVLILAASSPVATMIAMLTQKFGGGDGVYASHLASLSSVLCIVTMPLMALLAQALLENGTGGAPWAHPWNGIIREPRRRAPAGVRRLSHQ